MNNSIGGGLTALYTQKANRLAKGAQAIQAQQHLEIMTVLGAILEQLRYQSMAMYKNQGA